MSELQPTTEWVTLDPEALDNEQRSSVKGVRVVVAMSPYDIPRAARGYYSDERDCFVVEFQYLGDEPTRRQPSGDVYLRVGKNSGRIYGIEIDVQKFDANMVELLIVNELDKMAAKPTQPMRRSNYQAAKRAIGSQKRRLFESLAHS